MQVARAFTRHVALANRTPGKQLILCSTDPVAFRANLRAHVDVMAPLGFNAYALGVLATRALALLYGTPEDLAAHYTALRTLFSPWGDQLADSLGRTNITSSCLPAVAADCMNSYVLGIKSVGHVLTSPEGTATSDPAPISRLHKAMLAGPAGILVQLA